MSRLPHFLDNHLTDGEDAGRSILPRRFLVLISVRGVNPTAIMQLQKLKKKCLVTSLGIEAAVFRPIA
jgi:hypothetical protein